MLFWDTLRQRGNNWLAHEAAGKPPVLIYEYEMIADARTFERPVNYALVRIIPPRACVVDDTHAPVRDRRSARGTWSGHRRLQGRLRSRRRAHGRASGLLRDLLSRSDARADAGRRHRRGSRIHPHRRGASSAEPEAGARRQLPGRLGGDDARGVAARHRGALRHQRRADVVLGRQRRREPDALRGRSAGRRLARRCSRATWARGKFDGAHLVSNFENLNPANALWDKYVPPLREHRHRAPSASSSSSAGGAASTSSTTTRSAGSSTTCSSATSFPPGDARLGPGRYFDLKSIKSADHRVRVDGRQHHAAAAGVQLDRRPVFVDRGDQGERARPSWACCTRTSVTSASSSPARSPRRSTRRSSRC